MHQQAAKSCCFFHMMRLHSCNAHYTCTAQVRLQAVPEQGCILVSHPLLRDPYSSYFHQTIVLLCRHSFASGTYGLFLNRLLSADAKAKVNRMIRRHGSRSPQQPAGSSSGLDLARDMPAALQAMLGQSFIHSITSQHAHVSLPMCAACHAGGGLCSICLMLEKMLFILAVHQCS